MDNSGTFLANLSACTCLLRWIPERNRIRTDFCSPTSSWMGNETRQCWKVLFRGPQYSNNYLSRSKVLSEAPPFCALFRFSALQPSLHFQCILISHHICCSSL